MKSKANETEKGKEVTTATLRQLVFVAGLFKMESKYNKRSPAVKRLMREAMELREPTEQYYAQPLQDNLFEWHFSVRGPSDSPFAHGVYHGRIILPSGYPLQPPEIILLTPSGRFEVGKKVCLSISGHHPETWQPSWSIRTALLALIGFMATRGEGALGSLDYPPSEQLLLASRHCIEAPSAPVPLITRALGHVGVWIATTPVTMIAVACRSIRRWPAETGCCLGDRCQAGSVTLKICTSLLSYSISRRGMMLSQGAEGGPAMTRTERKYSVLSPFACYPRQRRGSRETCCDVCGARMDRVLLEHTPVNVKTVTTARRTVETTSRTQTTDTMTPIARTTAMEKIETNTMETFSTVAVTSATNNLVCAAPDTTNTETTIASTATEGTAMGKTDVKSSVLRVEQENILPELHHRGTIHPASSRSSSHSSSTSQAVYTRANLCSSSHILSAVLVIVIAIALAFLILRRLSRETGF
uniref:uncharacterized protein isoform X2 n=1 Tax=Myxine glutinosa TaxID=7769 RepID=UPI00358E63A5